MHLFIDENQIQYLHGLKLIHLTASVCVCVKGRVSQRGCLYILPFYAHFSECHKYTHFSVGQLKFFFHLELISCFR